MTRAEYWKECLSQAAEECDVKLTDEQLNYLADAVQGGHENIGQAFYQPEHPALSEVSRLKRELSNEKEKIICPECKGRGVEVIHGPFHSGVSQCWKCRGEGKAKP